VAQSFETRVGWPIDEGSEYTPGVLYRLTPSGPAYATEAETVAAIIAESTKAANDAGGRPLPLAGSWNNYFVLSDQFSNISAGYPVLPWVFWWKTGTTGQLDSGLSTLVSSGLPFVLVSTQWDEDLLNDSEFTSLPDADTAQTVTAGGRQTKLSPMGSVQPWSDCGENWGTCAQIVHLQSQYASPPRVLFLSNNEAPPLYHFSAADDTRYVSTYGTTTAGEKMAHFHYRWVDRYSALCNGIVSNIDAAGWQGKVATVGYLDSRAVQFRLTDAWFNSYNPVSATVDRIDYHSRAWGGVSPEIYDTYQYWSSPVSGSYPINDKAPFLTWSPQNDSMTTAMLRDMAYSVNQDYWFEISIWDGELWEGADGYTAYPNVQKALDYRTLGIDVSPSYYKGWAQYCMWIAKPRCAREFRYVDLDNANSLYGDYWQSILDMVAHVHSEATLRRFWRLGTQVENTAVICEYPSGVFNTHPYQNRAYTADSSFDGTVWNGYPKNCHLATNLDPTYSAPWPIRMSDAGDNLERPVYTMAHVIGVEPNREWLIYAHSTGIDGATLSNVVVTIPDYDDVTLPTVPIEGAFYYIREAA
jgi:hypothetical protein